MINILFLLLGLVIGFFINFIIMRLFLKKEKNVHSEQIRETIKLLQKTIMYLKDIE